MLDDEEMAAIAHMLFGTTKNVYSVASAMYNYDWQDADFSILKDKFNIQHCLECSEWKHVDDMHVGTNYCQECVGEDVI